ncbi:PTS mannose/fructose/sorbose/N-acetylgalactosamine transporter subunit IIC [Lacticaseibacillus pantheris]|jgi:PTS system mannose-specific IIC component|uniref:PTS mannose/fructose/sorbose/N-acetylgalactosamine transporter subunit IIC n=1 Tax=Lacticaseibacillus pantheris TaxID=171523 RepID=UPI0006D19BE9|nr:PTS sugar transporter subunit IIC [Lacticaseibacillus pantheris]
MLIKALLIGIISIVAMLDSRMFGRSNLERPLIVSTLVGLVLGDVTKGLMVGASLELISMGLVNVGAAVATDMVLGSIIATAFAILSNTSAQAALTVAIPIAVFGQLLGIVVRMLMSSLSHMAERDIEKGKFKRVLSYHIVWGNVFYSLMYFVPTFIAIYFGTGVVSEIVKQIPDWLTNGLTLSSKILPAFGFALLMSTMLSKKTAVYLFLGFFITAYANISVTGVAIFAVLLALVVNEFMPKTGNTETPASSNASSSDTDDDDLEEL